MRRPIWAAPEVEISPSLQFLRAEQQLELSPDDAARLGVKSELSDQTKIVIVESGDETAGVIVDEVEEEIFKTFEREVPSGAVGRLVTERLRRVDQVAYVRFASVYKQFKTLEELVDEAKAVIEARRYEDPGQGMFWENPKAAQAGHDGEEGNGAGKGRGRAGRVGKRAEQASAAAQAG